MHGLSEEQLLLALLAMAAILVVGRGSAEVARRVGQPEVLGELIGGFLLGPSVFGALLPSVYSMLFLHEGVGPALSILSWIGAILLLLIAGLEADLALLREMARPGSLAAGFAIVASIAAGTLFATQALGRPLAGGLFLGLALSVTAVSVAAKILIERGTLRRGYAQVILAAGIASEVVVWPLISVVGALKSGDPLPAGLRSAFFAVLFFALMMTAGRRFTFWAMRRITDMTQVVNGQLTLVLVLGFLSAAATQALGLHALLGAFVFGVLFGQAPRANLQLREKVQTLAVSFFAPVFFVLAGMRVDIYELRSPAAIGSVLLLFAVATLVKVGFAGLGARLGGMGTSAALLVGLGVNLKGGTDVIVAILGMELGLLSAETYTLYAVVAILTVLVSPPVMAFLERHVPPSEEEQARLNREEAKRRSYLADVERILVPLSPELQPATAAVLVKRIAQSKAELGEIFDITRLTLGVEQDETGETAAETVRAEDALSGSAGLERIEVTTARSMVEDPLAAIMTAAKGHRLIAVGARRPASGPVLSLGALQDRLLETAGCDILVGVHRDGDMDRPVRRILVPINGQEYSLSAGDVAAYLARSYDAEVVLFNAVQSWAGARFWRERRNLLEAGQRILQELRFRIERLDVRCSERVAVGEDPGQAIMEEVRRRQYDLVVLGAIARSSEGHLYLGRPTHQVLTGARVPVVLLVTHEAQPGAGGHA